MIIKYTILCAALVFTTIQSMQENNKISQGEESAAKALVLLSNITITRAHHTRDNKPSSNQSNTTEQSTNKPTIPSESPRFDN